MGDLRRAAGRGRRAINALLSRARRRGTPFGDYPIDPVPRYGHGRPPHPELTERLKSGDASYRALLRSFQPFVPQLLRIPLDAHDASEPFWDNAFFSGL